MFLKRVLTFPRTLMRQAFRIYQCLRLRNRNFTIISRDCVGGMLLHYFFMRFDTPTINLYFTAQDFLIFCSRLKFYVSQELKECTSSGKDFPVGTLGEGDDKITVYFLHYDNFAQAKQKWEERCGRIHWNNIYFIMNDGEGCNEIIAKKFDELPHTHKVLLTYRNLEGVRSAVKLNISSYNKNGIGAPHVLAYRSALSIRRVIDDWDYVGFLNS